MDGRDTLAVTFASGAEVIVPPGEPAPQDDPIGDPLPDDGGTASTSRGLCGAMGMINLLWMFAGLGAMRTGRRRVQPRQPT